MHYLPVCLPTLLATCVNSALIAEDRSAQDFYRPIAKASTLVTS